MTAQVVSNGVAQAYQPLFHKHILYFGTCSLISLVMWATEIDTGSSSSTCQPSSIKPVIETC